MYLFCSPDASACGCYFLSRLRAAADLSLPVPALDEALREFERRKLVALDHETGEIFVLSWPRWMNFKTPQARGALWSSIDRVKSQKLSTFVKKAYESIARPGKGVGVGKGLPPSSVNRDARLLPAGWWGDEQRTIAAGKQLGIESPPGESMEMYRSRIRAALAGQQPT